MVQLKWWPDDCDAAAAFISNAEGFYKYASSSACMQRPLPPHSMKGQMKWNLWRLSSFEIVIYMWWFMWRIAFVFFFFWGGGGYNLVISFEEAMAATNQSMIGLYLKVQKDGASFSI